MKKVIYFLALFCVAITLNAQTRLIAVKGKNTDTVVKTFSNALKVAKEGDVIYLPGGVYTSNDTIKKKVHIIGSGYNDIIPRATSPTRIFGAFIIAKKAKGSVIEGVLIKKKSKSDKITIYADNITFRRCEIERPLYFIDSRNNQVINCIIDIVTYAKNLKIYNSLVNVIMRSKYVEINNSIVNSLMHHNSEYKSSYTVSNNVIFKGKTAYGYAGVYKSDDSEYINCRIGGFEKGVFKKFEGNFFNLDNNYQLTDSIAKAYPKLGIYKGQYPWKDGGQPITPHIEENNSYLDVQSQTFKLRVKVRAQSK